MKLENGMANYTFPRSSHSECRVFVKQENGRVSARERISHSYFLRRRIELTGLQNATVRFFFEDYCKDDGIVHLNTDFMECYFSDSYDGRFVSDGYGTYFEVRNVTGTLTFSMPRRDTLPRYDEKRKKGEKPCFRT